MIPILQIYTLRYREGKWLAHKHTESKALSWDSHPKNMASETILLPFFNDLTSTTY